MNAVVDLGVYPVRGDHGRYHIKAGKRNGLLHLVDLNELTSGWCGCESFEFRNKSQLVTNMECKHIRLARVYQGLQHCFGGCHDVC